MLGIFSDMETGTKILLLVIFALFVYFGGKNVLHDSGGKKGGKGGRGKNNNDDSAM